MTLITSVCGAIKATEELAFFGYMTWHYKMVQVSVVFALYTSFWTANTDFADTKSFSTRKLAFLINFSNVNKLISR